MMRCPVKNSKIALQLLPLLSLSFFVLACPPSEEKAEVGEACSADKPCADNLTCVDGNCVNAASEDAGVGGPVEDNSCVFDTDCGVAEVCDDATQLCITGLDCSLNATICGFCVSGDQDCGFDPAPAYCDANAGVCRRVHSSCMPCVRDSQCTTADAYYDNHCVSYPDGNYCGVDCAHGQACPRGFSCTEGICLLEEVVGTCTDAPSCNSENETEVCPTGTYCTTRDFPGRQGVCLNTCLTDDDCTRPQICRSDPGPRYGTCIDGCSPAGTVMGSGVCHEDGRAGAYCATDSDCLGIVGIGGFECHDNSGHCDGRTCQGWCEQGGCDDSSECPLPRSYCDQASRTCLDGCAVDGDCGAFELCDTDTHSCHTQPCRGKDLSCGLEQWCCGTELYDNSAEPEHRDCPADVEFGACFQMSDPYCRTCEDNDDCLDIHNFGYDSFCYELTKEDDQGNEISLGKYCSVGCETNMDCPRGIACIQELPDPNDENNTLKGCLDARCVP